MSAGLYVHLPFCASKCAYCAFVSGVFDDGVKAAYVDALLRELDARKGEVDAVDTVYFGGGTPGQLPVPVFLRLSDGIRAAFGASFSEVTFETNPETVTEAYAAALVEAGVDRVSLGLQTADDGLLARIGRRHDRAGFVRAVRRLHAVGIGNVSADLMLGLPGQTLAHVTDAVRLVADEGLTHASVYALKVEPGTPLYGYEPDDDFVADCYDAAVAALAVRGYARYETSNFCRAGYECLHNLKYWTCGDYLGLGAAAHSLTRGERSYDASDVGAYIAGAPVTRVPRTRADEKEEYIMLALRLERGIARADYRARFGTDFVEEHRDALASLGACVAIDEERVRIAPDKAFVANSVIVRLI